MRKSRTTKPVFTPPSYTVSVPRATELPNRMADLIECLAAGMNHTEAAREMGIPVTSCNRLYHETKRLFRVSDSGGIVACAVAAGILKIKAVK